ncbi:MAG: tryptophan synthase subunit alpha [Candidatus Bathyarchaeia archaeon]|nr:tryptophan synthase subunit alpha [Candidatus Bathyarchaeota archaeon]
MHDFLPGTSKERVLMVYLTAGDPCVNGNIINILSESGVDAFEFGIPMAKPKYDGLVIKASYRRALENGATLEKIFQFMRDLNLDHKIIFTYFDYAKNIGIEKFMSYVQNAGAEGVLFPDLLIDYLDELDKYIEICKQCSLEPIFFITSSFPHNLIIKLARLKPAFIYLGLMASTGTLLPITISRNIRIIRGLIGDTPLLVGFAISKPSQIMDCVRAGADGVIIGSAIIRLISQEERGSAFRENLRNYIISLKRALEA